MHDPIATQSAARACGQFPPQAARSAPASPIRHRNTLDLLRLFAATVVVIGHTTAYLGHSFLSFLGPIDGVGMFFVMSGMLVYRSGERSIEKTGKWFEYFRNRFLRIAPAIYWYVAISTVLLFTIGAVSISALASSGVVVWIAGSIFLVPDYHPAAFAHFGSGILNGSLWSIPAEVSFYLLVPFLFYAARRFGFNRMIVAVAIAAIIVPLLMIHLAPSAQNVLHHTFFERLAYFGIGVFWARHWDTVKKSWALFALAVIVWIALTKALPGHVNQFLWPVALALPLSYATIFFGYRGPKVLARVTERVGDLSFGTYIWHMPIVNFFLWEGWHGSWCMPVVILTAWSFAAVSWWLIERRALLLKRVSERFAETGMRVAA